jgi:hypothetical protein
MYDSTPVNVMIVDEDEDSLLSEGTPDSPKTYHLREIRYQDTCSRNPAYKIAVKRVETFKPPLA